MQARDASQTAAPPAPSRAWTRAELAGDPHQAADKPQRVRAMFASIAGAYDLNNRLHSFGRDQAWRRAAVRRSQLRPGDAVLDVACGTGDLAFAFLDAGAASVVGVDFTEEMLHLARQKAGVRARRAGGGATDAPRFEYADATALPYEDRSFDVVSIGFGLRNVSEPVRALSEFRRVLRTGGRLIILEFSRPRNPLLRCANDFYCRRLMPLTATLIARDHSGAYRYLPRSIETFLEGDAMRTAITGAGFVDVEAFSMTFGVCTIHRAVARDPSRH